MKTKPLASITAILTIVLSGLSIFIAPSKGFAQVDAPTQQSLLSETQDPENNSDYTASPSPSPQIGTPSPSTNVVVKRGIGPTTFYGGSSPLTIYVRDGDQIDFDQIRIRVYKEGSPNTPSWESSTIVLQATPTPVQVYGLGPGVSSLRV